MSVKPILFNTDMVRAILDGRKTVTRRKIKHNAVEEWLKSPYVPGMFTDDVQNIMLWIKPPYQPGDILYVRETWHIYQKRVGEGDTCRIEERYGYKASVANSEDADTPWKPSIHMPRKAARIWLRVTDVHAKRLCEMSVADAMAEGIDPKVTRPNVRGAFKEFQKVWDSTIKKSDLDRYGWDANPWVWVIEFERCEKQEGV